MLEQKSNLKAKMKFLIAFPPERKNPVNSTWMAEATRLLENFFRSRNILISEAKIIR